MSMTLHKHHCSHNEDMMEVNEGHDRRHISAPGKERPFNSAQMNLLSSSWPEKTTFCDQTSQKHLSPSYNKGVDARFPALSPSQEHLIWNDVTLHDFDTRVPRYMASNEGSKRVQSANYNIHHPQNYHHHYFYNNHKYGISPYRPTTTTFSASNSPSKLRSWGPSTIYNQGVATPQDGPRGQESRSPIVWCHHKCKLLNDVQEQKRSLSKAIASEDPHGHMMMMPRVFHQLLPNCKVGPLSDDKELVEWNNFVNQMTTTLLNLKDGLAQLIGPTEGAAAQQAASKLNQMPSSFFRSGMLRLLERSCKVLNSHVMSLARRHKDNVRHVNVGTENEAPAVNGATLGPTLGPTKKKKKMKTAPSRGSNSQHALLAKREIIQFEKGLNEKVGV